MDGDDGEFTVIPLSVAAKYGARHMRARDTYRAAKRNSDRGTHAKVLKAARLATGLNRSAFDRARSKDEWIRATPWIAKVERSQLEQ